MPLPRAYSLIDCLLETSSSLQRSSSRAQIMGMLAECIRIDLEKLLNTKRCHATWNPSFIELEKSVLNYGVDDFMGLSLDSNLAGEQLSLNYERAIQLFEPRLSNVRVLMDKTFLSTSRSIQFRIEGTLYIDPMYERVIFNSTWLQNTQQFTVAQELN